jgi:hypothetical protein
MDWIDRKYLPHLMKFAAYFLGGCFTPLEHLKALHACLSFRTIKNSSSRKSEYLCYYSSLCVHEP